MGHFAGGVGRFSGRGPRFASRPGMLPIRRRVISGSGGITNNRQALSNVARNRGAMASAARPSRTFPQRGLNGRMDHIAERHDQSWHGDWDRRHAHFDHGRFFVFLNGSWCGLDDGFFPWDYLPYSAADYYPYDYYPDNQSYPDNQFYPDNLSLPPDYQSYPDNQPTDNTEPTQADPKVRATQMELTELGYYNGPVDGVFGPTTRDAVARYQTTKQLNVTGSLSPDTLQSLGIMMNSEPKGAIRDPNWRY